MCELNDNHTALCVFYIRVDCKANVGFLSHCNMQMYSIRRKKRKRRRKSLTLHTRETQNRFMWHAATLWLHVSSCIKVNRSPILPKWSLARDNKEVHLLYLQGEPQLGWFPLCIRNENGGRHTVLYAAALFFFFHMATQESDSCKEYSR